jgi:hypothetical protein
MQQNLQEIKEKVTIRTKKETILTLYKAGVTEIEAISAISGAKSSYVGSVLQQEGLITGYFDLYTSTGQPMNVYSKHFQGKLGFKDIESAERGVAALERTYQHFERIQDRAGQHHSLEMALIMLDRARWTDKLNEAEIYRRWLMGKLSTPLGDIAKPSAVRTENAESVETEAEDGFKIAA